MKGDVSKGGSDHTALWGDMFWKERIARAQEGVHLEYSRGSKEGSVTDWSEKRESGRR